MPNKALIILSKARAMTAVETDTAWAQKFMKIMRTYSGIS